MSTEYEAHMVIGCELSEADHLGMEEDHFKEYLYSEHDMLWYEEANFVGKLLKPITTLNIHTVKQLGKTKQEVKVILGTEVTIRACILKY